MPDAPARRWWWRDEHLRRRPFLIGRNAVLKALRHWFEMEGFVPVEGAALQLSPGNETHLHAFSTEEIAADGAARRLYLHTSPEFAAKKLLAAGETRIVDIARVFRNRERSALHHPEFTMIEWYRAHAPYEALMDDVAALLPLAARIGGVARFQWRGRVCDPFAPPERLTVEEAFLRHAGFSLLATTESTEERNREAIAHKAKSLQVRIVDDDTWSDIFSRILSERIEPALGLGRPTILMEFPIAEAALARPKPADPRVAERFELYVSGVELANAFCELTDPVEQRRRFEADMALKQAIYGERYPLDEELLAALSLMPPTSGIALGFDRLAMLAVGAETIADVIWTPVAEGPMSGP